MAGLTSVVTKCMGMSSKTVMGNRMQRAAKCLSGKFFSRQFFQHKRKFLGTMPVIGIPCVLAQNEVKNSNSNNVDGSKSLSSEDKVSLSSLSEVNSNLSENNKKGWDNLCEMYELDEFGNLSKELNGVLQGTFMSCIVGFLYGGVLYSRTAFQDFMERNQATLYENHLDAKRRLSNHVTIHFAKGAFKWGWRVSLFTGGFLLFLTSMSRYRGSTSILDYLGSGALVGALVRIKLGPPGMIIGGIVGGVLGLFSGVLTQTLFSLSGTSLDEVLSYQYEIEQERLMKFKEAEKVYFENKEMTPQMKEMIEFRDQFKDKELENVT